MTLTLGHLAYGASRWHRVDLYHDDARVDVAVPSGRVVLLHGGFWRHDRVASHLEPMATALVAAGMTVAVPEYRPVWDGGAWPGVVDDVDAALVALADRDPAWGDAVLCGHSAGALPAAAVTAGRPGSRIVLLAPVVDLVGCRDRGLGAGAVDAFLAEETARGGSAAAATPLLETATVAALDVVSASEDQAVPKDYVREQVAAWSAAGLPVRHQEVAGARHMHLVKPARPAFATVLATLQQAAAAASRATPGAGVVVPT